MKAPDDIKEALRKCIGWNSGYLCGECPYWNGSAMCKPELCNDAIACIDQLEKKTKWISVKDRLPKNGTDVLVLTAPGTLSLGKNCVVAEYIHPRMEKSGVFINFYAGYDDKNILAVTHWMPMPEPPEEGLE